MKYKVGDLVEFIEPHKSRYDWLTIGIVIGFKEFEDSQNKKIEVIEILWDNNTVTNSIPQNLVKL